jgi:hypothetical protein
MQWAPRARLHRFPGQKAAAAQHIHQRYLDARHRAFPFDPLGFGGEQHFKYLEIGSDDQQTVAIGQIALEIVSQGCFRDITDQGLAAVQ